MDESSIINAHIQGLARDLKQAEMKLGLPQVEANLHQRVWVRLGQLIEKQQQELIQVQYDVDNDLSLETCWETFRNISEECQPILKECLALTQGAIVRSVGLDDQLCQIADFLLYGLSGLTDVPWNRFTILAEQEFYGEMAEIIRLRYPETSVWNLPVAAHEFGHFVVEKTGVNSDGGEFDCYVQQYQDLLPQVPQVEDERWRELPKEEQRRFLQPYEERQRRFLHEYYADVFAVYTMGPAYAYTCLLLRFDPRAAYEDGQGHPSYEKRARAILQTLEEMNIVKGSAKLYSATIRKFRCWWQKSVEAAHPPGNPTSEETLMLLEDFVATLHARLGNRFPKARYSGWSRATRLSGRLDPQSEVALKPVPRLRDVLNAAWYRRTNAQHDNRRGQDDALGTSARVLCKQIAEQSQQDPMHAV